MKLIQILCLLCLQMLSIRIQAQETKDITVSGIVVDINEQPIEDVSVYVKDRTTSGGKTGDDGKFNIKVKYGDKIVFNHVGFDPFEIIAVESKLDYKVILDEKSTDVEEVVIVGLGKQRKISSVGAITTVDVSQLQSPSASITNMLGGRAAGVIATMTSGEPGQNISEFWVRGIGTFGAGSGALVLIDGLEGDLNTIDPADVESFSILKDASATAVYGVRGANGVVLVTTKRGLVDRLSITARVNSTLSHLNRLPNYLDAYDYAKLANEASVVRGNTTLYNDTEMGIIRDHLDPDMYPNVNWQDEILNQNSWRQSYYLSGRGGSEVARYFLSLGGNSETAAYKVDKSSVYSSNVGFNNFNYRINLDMNISKYTKVFLGADGYLSILNKPGMANTDFIWSALTNLTPLAMPTVYSNGLYPARGANGGTSPSVLINRTGKATDQTYKGKTTIALDQDLSPILSGLKLRLQGAYDIHSIFNEARYVQPPLYQALGRSYDGSLIMKEMVQEQPAIYGKTTNQYRKFHLESTINYDKIYGVDHRVSGLVYYYVSDAKETEESVNNLSAIPIRYQGVSSRFTYGFRDTYLLDVNFGYTGSENFQPGRQYGFFPSVALGWVPTSYKSVQENLPWLNYLKLRGSYGTVGNDRITSIRFPYLTKVDVSNSTVWGSPSSVETIRETRIGADNLAWERAVKSNIGLEGKLFNNKFDFVVDVFQDQRNGIFQQRVQVPEYVGVITMPFGNVGKMKSLGADGNASYIMTFNQDFSATIRGNFTYSKNTVQNWEQAYLEYPYLENNGYSHGALRGYQADGLFKDEDDIKYSPQQSFGAVMPGDIKYKDVNGDGLVDALDRVPLSHSTFPILMFGFGGEFSYKKISLGVLFKGTGNTPYFHSGQSVTRKVNGTNVTYINGMGYLPFYEGEIGNVMETVNDLANRWIPMDYAVANGIDPALAENPNAKYPRLQFGRNNNNSQLSTFWQGDARYLRLQEVTLRYNVTANLLRRIGVNSMDLQFVGNNLYIWDKVKLFDPEQAQFNGEKYPIPSTYSLQVYLNL